MPEPSREAIEAAAPIVDLIADGRIRTDGAARDSAAEVLEAAYPIIRRDVAREIAERFREDGPDVDYAAGGFARDVADYIEREFGGDDG